MPENADVPQNGSAFARVTSLSNYYPSNSEPEIALMCEQGHLWMQGPVNGPKSQPQQPPLQTLPGPLSYRSSNPSTANQPSQPSEPVGSLTTVSPRCKLLWYCCGHSFYIGTILCKEPGSASIQFLCAPQWWTKLSKSAPSYHPEPVPETIEFAAARYRLL